jgi:hypothetical protein
MLKVGYLNVDIYSNLIRHNLIIFIHLNLEKIK